MIDGFALNQNLVMLAVGGWLIAQLRSVPSTLWSLVQRRLYLSATVDNEDELFELLVRWLGRRAEVQRSGVLRLVSTWTQFGDSDNGHRTAGLAPGDGEHLVRYNGHRFWLSMSTDSAPTGGMSRRREVTVRCRKKSRPVLAELVNEVCALAVTDDPDYTRIFTASDYGWSKHARRRNRPTASVILDGDTLETLLSDMRQFEADQARYQTLDVPYRRGYLLYGPPGNGKSTLALTLAGALNRDLYVLPLGDSTLNDQKLLRLLQQVPARSVVVCEDVDTVFNGRQREAENKLTLSGVLNAMDGIVATEGRILMMTTNHRDVLDPALIRPGRADVHCELRNATPGQARNMFTRFFPEASALRAEQFAHWAGDGSHSMASLQVHLVQNMRDEATAAQRSIAPVDVALAEAA